LIEDAFYFGFKVEKTLRFPSSFLNFVEKQSKKSHEKKKKKTVAFFLSAFLSFPTNTLKSE